MISPNECKKCGEEYTYYWSRWCKTCHFKTNFTNSGNEKIDNIIKTMQLKIDSPWDIVFEWIPYNKFDNIEEINKGDYSTVYSAIWKGGPLNYDDNKKEYLRRF